MVETRCRNSSLSIDAAVSPPPMTATRSAAISSCCGGPVPELRDRQHPRIARQDRPFGLTRPGDHHRVGVHGALAGVQRPTRPSSPSTADRGDLAVAARSCRCCRPPSAGTGSTAGGSGAGRPRSIHSANCPVRDQVGLPAVPGHPLVEFGVAPRHQRRPVREADVLLRAGAQPVLTVGPAAGGLPVGGHRGAFDRPRRRVPARPWRAVRRPWRPPRSPWRPAPMTARVGLVSLRSPLRRCVLPQRLQRGRRPRRTESRAA